MPVASRPKYASPSYDHVYKFGKKSAVKAEYAHFVKYYWRTLFAKLTASTQNNSKFERVLIRAQI